MAQTRTPTPRPAKTPRPLTRFRLLDTARNSLATRPQCPKKAPGITTATTLPRIVSAVPEPAYEQPDRWKPFWLHFARERGDRCRTAMAIGACLPAERVIRRPHSQRRK